LHTRLRGKTELIIVPDGVLWELPFQALQSSARRYVIEDMAVSYAPSITVLREMMRVAAIRRPLARSGVWESFSWRARRLAKRQNVRRLAEIYGASSRGPDWRRCPRRSLESGGTDYRVVHLATHGVLDDASPLYSHLLLAVRNRAARRRPARSWEI